MSARPEPGPVEAKRRPGLHERWLPARLVRWDGPPIVIFKGERDEVAAYRVRVPKTKPARASRAPSRLAAEEGCSPEEQMEQAEPEAEEPHEIVRVSTRPRLKSVFRQPPPDICDEYRQWVKTLPCANRRCPTPGEHIDPHHEGKKGVSQKRPDWDCVPLCWRCHKTITDEYEIPGYTREETTAWLADVKNELKNRLLSAIDRGAVVAALRVMTRSAAA